MANVERELGDLEPALNHARSAVRIAEETLEPRHPDRAWALILLPTHLQSLRQSAIRLLGEEAIDVDPSVGARQGAASLG